jgi:hypothetical protein
MDKIEMELGKIYSLDYGGNTQIVGRFLEDTTTQYIFFDLLHCWNGFKTFRGKNPYCVHSGIENIREASKSEKMNLVRFELEHNCI